MVSIAKYNGWYSFYVDRIDLAAIQYTIVITRFVKWPPRQSYWFLDWSKLNLEMHEKHAQCKADDVLLVGLSIPQLN